MKNENGNNSSVLEAEVRDAVEAGRDVQEKVRQLTLHIISSRSLDIESVRETAGAVLRGARAGVQKELQHSSAQTSVARERLKQAVAGLDVALAQLKPALSPWMRFFVTYDPQPALQKVKCPVLALNGERDLQVPPSQNLPAIEKALRAGGNSGGTTRCAGSGAGGGSTRRRARRSRAFSRSRIEHLVRPEQR